MKKSNLLINSLIGFSMLGSVSMSHADDDTGAYLGVNVNRASAHFHDENDLNFDDSDNAYGVKAGYMFNNFFGLEAGYLDLGEFSARGDGPRNRIELDAKGYSAAFVFNWTIIDQLDLYGKAGAFRINAESNSLVAGQVINRDEDATEPFASIGVEWDLGLVNLYSEYTVVDTDIHDLSVDIASAGIKFEF